MAKARKAARTESRVKGSRVGTRMPGKVIGNVAGIRRAKARILDSEEKVLEEVCIISMETMDMETKEVFGMVMEISRTVSSGA